MKKIMTRICSATLCAALVAGPLPGMAVPTAAEEPLQQTAEAALRISEDVALDELHFPDEQFRAVLSAKVDGNRDGVLSPQERSAVTDLNCEHCRIGSLEGIEYFSELMTLRCEGNRLTKLDMRGNPKLCNLYCAYNDLSLLLVNGCSELFQLMCNGNNLTSLNLRGNPNLGDVDFSNNQLSSLDLSANPSIFRLMCSNNKLTSLDLTPTPKLGLLYCSDNQLTELDLGNLPRLKDLRCSDNPLNVLDLSANPKLTELSCSNDRLNVLDLSANPNLTSLWCEQNMLNTLDLSANPRLNTLICSNNRLRTLDTAGLSSLKSLSCDNNQLTALDLSANIWLELIHCEGNQLTALMLPRNNVLRGLWCEANRLQTLELGSQPAFEMLGCDQNELSELKLDYVPLLRSLSCAENNLTALDLTANPELVYLGCGRNQLTMLDLGVQTALTELDFSGNEYTAMQPSFDYLELPGMFDPDLVTDLTGASLDRATHTFVFDDGIETATYRYDMGIRNPDCAVTGDVFTIHCQTPRPEGIKGTWGENITYLFDPTAGKLTISGQGVMRDRERNTSGVVTEAFPWEQFREQIVSVKVETGVTSLAQGTFEGCTQLSEVSLPDSVTVMGENAFAGCEALMRIALPEKLTELAPHLFEGCTGLRSISVPDDVRCIGERAFRGCDNLASVSLPRLLEQIGVYAFSSCGQLRSISIPDPIQTIEEGTFSSCGSLKSIYFPAGLQRIESAAFNACGFEQLELPEHLDFIGGWAFAQCPKLTAIRLPGAVRRVDESCFADCTDLSSVTFDGNAPIIGSDAFHGVTATVHYPGGAGWSPDALQNYGGNLTWTAFPAVFGANMTLGSNLVMNFFIRKADVPAERDYVLVMNDGIREQKIPLAQWQTYTANPEFYVFPCESVVAKEMNREIRLQVQDLAGNPVSEVWTDSVRGYVMRMLEKHGGAPEYRYADAQMVDLLNYGAGAQNYFGVNLEDPANALLNEAQRSLATPDEALVMQDIRDDSDPNYYGSNLNLGTNLTMKFFFRGATDKMYADVTVTHYTGCTETVRVLGTDFVDYQGVAMGVPVTCVNVADYNQPVQVTVYNENGTVYASATDSIESYIARKNSPDKPLFLAVEKFCYSARKYFENR